MPRTWRPKPEPPICKRAVKFIQTNYGRGHLAPLTGQDWRVFEAVMHLIELWGCGDLDGQRAAERAIYHALTGMQAKCRWVCKVAIPCALDWSHEEKLWSRVMMLGPELSDTPTTHPARIQ